MRKRIYLTDLTRSTSSSNEFKTLLFPIHFVSARAMNGILSGLTGACATHKAHNSRCSRLEICQGDRLFM